MKVRTVFDNPLQPLALYLGTTTVTWVLASIPAWGQISSARETIIQTQPLYPDAEEILLPQTAGDKIVGAHSARSLNAEGLEVGISQTGAVYQSWRSPSFPLSSEELAQGPANDREIFPPEVDEEDSSNFAVIPLPRYSSIKGFHATVDFLLWNIGDRQQIMDLRLEGGEQTLGAQFRYTDPWAKNDPFDQGFQVRLFNTRAPEDVFLNGDREVQLIHDHTPWVDRLGGSIEVFQPVNAEGLTVSAGASYQRVAIRNAAVTDKVFSRDQFGNRVSFSDDGIDNIVTINLSAFQDRRNSEVWPTEGYRFWVGTEQSIPIGNADILFNRVSASYSQFVSFGSQTFAFNVQGGTYVGDVPAYEAFSLGGNDSARGYKDGEVGAGSRFFQAAAEYRFPIVQDLDLPFVSRLGGAVFVDYATDLGSGDDVRGEPGEVREKPGSGLGFGVGVRVLTDFGPLRFDFALNDEGDVRTHLRLGERF